MLTVVFNLIGVLAEAEEVPELILKSDGMPALLDAMQKHLNEAAIQQKGCVLIQVLARFLSDDQCQPAVTAVIEAMCKLPDDMVVQAEGCVAMFVIAQTDPQKSQILVNNCAHERLFFVLENHVEDKRLTSLASECLVYLGKERDLKAHMLLSACAGGLMRAVQCLVEMGADVNAGQGTNTPLCAACKNCKEEVVQFLLMQGISDVQSALRLCIEMGHDSLVGILLQHIGHEKEAGIITWSGLNLGALRPEWISPALSGKKYTRPRRQSLGWTGLFEDAERTMRKRASISSILTSSSASLYTSPVERQRSVSQTDAPLAHLLFTEEQDSPDEHLDESDPKGISELESLTEGELTEVSPPRVRSLSGASLPFSSFDPRVVSACTDGSHVILPQSARRKSVEERPVTPTDPSPERRRMSLKKRRCYSNLEPSSVEGLDTAFCASPESDTPPENQRRRRKTSILGHTGVGGVFRMPSHSFLYSPDSQLSRPRSLTSFLGSDIGDGSGELNLGVQTFPLKRRKHTRVAFKVNPLATIRLIDASVNGIEDLQPIASAGGQLLTHFTNVEKLDLSRNKLSYFPSELCDAMPKLEHVNLSRNEFEDFPLYLVKNTRLKVLNMSHNKIDSLPKSTSTSLSMEKLDMSYNTLSRFPEWIDVSFPALSSLNVANNDITELPHSPLTLRRLKTLNVSHNKITQIYEAFLSECFCLEELNASSNELTTLPEAVAPFLAKLKVLRLAKNKLAEKISFFVPLFVLMLPNVRIVDLSRNKLLQLPPPRDWMTQQLKELVVAHNKIKRVPLKEGIEKWASLERLVLCNNNLRHVPKGIGELSSLTSLDLSHNPLSHLPDEMGRLSNLWDLQLNGLKLDLNSSIVESKTKELIAFLHAKLKNSVPYYRMKLVLVGLPGRGKTTLLNQLRGEKSKSCNSDVEEREWLVKDTGATCGVCHRKCVCYTISAWEIRGDQNLYNVLQCLLSTRTLYLAVYDVKRGTEEMEKLKPWLLTLHSCAPEASVMLVGTHLDKVPKDRVNEVLQRIKDHALNMCSDPGFPQVKSHVVLNCTEETSGVRVLRRRIMELIVRCKCKGQSLIGIHVPHNYVRLQDLIQQQAGSPSEVVPVLRRADVRGRIQDNDVLMDEGELDQAMRFLHEAGMFCFLSHSFLPFLLFSPQTSSFVQTYVSVIVQLVETLFQAQ